MGKRVNAKNGDSLCGFAVTAGFINCDPLRDEPANSALLDRPLVDGDIVTIPDVKPKSVAKPTEKEHKFVKKNSPPVSIRFVRPTPSNDYLKDFVLNVLNVSNFVTNLLRKDGSSAFPRTNAFDPSTNEDIDAFQVQVVDPGADGQVEVALEALKPVKQADASIQYESISGVSNSEMRKISQLLCDKLSSPIAFRSEYLRLVVDERDRNGLPNNTLLTAETVDAGDESLEILDQHVRATYTIPRCNGQPKCMATAELPIGQDKKRVRVAVHILEDPATQQPVATVKQVRQSILKYVRQVYAQACMSVKIINIRTIPAPTNLIAIANDEKGSAEGNKTIKIRAQIGQRNQPKFDFDGTVQVVTKAYDNPMVTATALANALNAAFKAAMPPFNAVAKASENQNLTGQQMASADVVVGDPLTQRVTLTVIEAGDPNQAVSLGIISNTAIPEAGSSSSQVGTLLERTLVKNYASGSDRINLFVVGQIDKADQTFGESFIPVKWGKAYQQPFPPMTNSALVVADVLTKPEFHYTTTPHEMGHILMDAFHVDVTTELMYKIAGSADDRAMDGPKRISDTTIPFDAGHPPGNPVTLLRTANKDLLEDW